MPKVDTKDFVDYTERLGLVLAQADWNAIGELTADLRTCWRNGNRLFLCGNGGSAANAMHAANDLFYGIAKGNGLGLSAQALPSNVALLTCLANDEGYAEIYSRQLAVDGRKGDVLTVFSGSGNSANIVRVLEQAKSMGIKSYAILGYSGGKAKLLADVPIHFPIDDMQISEDVQLIVFHMIMQWLWRNGPGTA